MADNNHTVIDPHIIAKSGCQVNSSGGLYRESTVTTVEKYVVILNKYEETCAFDRSKKVRILTITNHIKVDCHISKKSHIVT